MVLAMDVHELVGEVFDGLRCGGVLIDEIAAAHVIGELSC